ncbi:MAG TPA: hypothetical protein DCL35_01895 [Candidatus Omnitrophica bacterium]|nr:hypothetical protein [Candidatus Omnitrophota bacterium]
MYILGISCYFHDAAACLLKDGEVIAAAEEERFSRVKHDPSFPVAAIKFCLDSAGIEGKDLDLVVFNEKPFLKFERILKTVFSTYPRSCALFKEVMVNWIGAKLWIKSLIEEKIGVPQDKVLFCEHHVSHAASAFFCSPFKDAAILTCDGTGEWATTAIGEATADWTGKDNNDIRLSEEIRFPHSLGLLYSAFTAFLGFEVNEGEYKVMGMAAFGEPKYVDKVYEVIKVADDGSFRIDMRYFSYHYSATRSFNKRFVKLFGKPRDPGARFAASKEPLYDDPVPVTDEEVADSKHYADIAASIQKVVEQILVKIANNLYKKTGLKRLCFAGGVALNCVANREILDNTPFEEIFIHPAGGDSGGAMGAALYAYHCYLKQRRKFVLSHAYWGRQYAGPDIKRFLDENSIPYRYFKDESELFSNVVEALMSQKVVGWFQGRSEWGPRALGNRSILADPRRREMKDTVNIKIKFREPFRPFAPSVLEDKAAEYFELGKAGGQYPLRFMLYTVPVNKKDLVPAVTHVDGTSRLQAVGPETNPRFYRLIERFYEKTGVPVLLNTSFNLRGEPIVETPQDAFNTYLKCGMDVLVLGDYLLEK